MVQQQSYPGASSPSARGNNGETVMVSRRYVGTPRLSGPIEALMFLVAWIAFLLMMIAYSAPTWKTFASTQGDVYSVGLWTACRNNFCTYAWASYSPMVYQHPLTNQTMPGLYFEDRTPDMIATAQAFIMMGLIWHLFSTCCWVEGPGSAAVSLLIPSIFYTIGIATGVSFFNTAQSTFKGDSSNILNLSWGYAAECGFAGVAMIWLSVLVFIMVAVVNRDKEQQPRPVLVTDQYYVMSDNVARNV